MNDDDWPTCDEHCGCAELLADPVARAALEAGMASVLTEPLVLRDFSQYLDDD